MKERKGFRKIVVDESTWQYKVGDRFVVAYSEYNSKMQDTIFKVAGLSEEEFKEWLNFDVREAWLTGEVRKPLLTPKHVAAWLSK